MQRIMFFPVSAVAGLVAGMVSQRIFRRVWLVVDEHEPPKPNQARATMPKLALALVIEGAVFRLVRGLGDRAARAAYRKATGSWPGEKQAAARRT